MANKLTVFPQLQGITIRNKDLVLPDWRNFYHFDEAPLLQSLRKGALQYPYKQKVQYTHRQTLYFFTNAYFTGGASNVYIALVDCKGNAIVEIDPTVPTTGLTTDTYTYKSDDIVEDTDVIMYRWRYTPELFPEGEYYVYIQVTYGDDSKEEFISEPQWVRTKHKTTARIDYTHTADDHEVLFATMGVSFNVTVDTNWLKLRPSGAETTYEEQDEELRRTYGKYYRLYELNLKRLPEYMTDKLAAIFLNCSNVSIEGRRFIKDADSEVEYDRANTSAVGNGKVMLREYFNNRSGLLLNTSINLVTLPGTYPCLWGGFVVTDSVTWGQWGPIEFLDSAAVNTFITTINSEVAVQQMDATGSFSRIGDSIIFQNAPGENFVVQISNQVLDDCLHFTVENVVNSAPVRLTASIADTLGGYIVWADTTPVYTLINTFPYNTWQEYSHTFSANGNKQIRAYSSDNLRMIGVGYQTGGQTGKVTAITGKTAPYLLQFILIGQDIDGPIDLRILSNARAVIERVNLEYCGITSLTNNWLTEFPGWPMLKLIELGGNALDSTAQDNFYNDFEQYSGYTYSGIIQTSAQTPSASPTVASEPARDDLAAAGWALL